MGETQPLLQNGFHETLERTASKDRAENASVVDFDPNGDPENPIDWPDGYKWVIVALLAFMAFTVTFTCISVVPVANRIVKDLNPDGQTDKSASVLIVTIWELGESAGPLLIGPLSEVVGRARIFIAANLLFIAATVFAALCQNTHLFIAARCLTGIAVAANVLNPAVVGDIYIPEQRGTAMSLIMLAPLLGGAFGPAIAGAIAERAGWRYILWMAVALASACEVVFVCCFRETYKVTILRRKAAKLRLETGDTNINTIFDLASSETSEQSFWRSITRPFTVLVGSPVLQAISLSGSMTFTFFYIFSTTLPDILESLYDLSPALTGMCFLCFSVGSVACVILCNAFLDRIYIKLKESNSGVGLPEFRLPLVIVGSITLPMTIAMYGWNAQLHLPLPVVLVFVALLGATTMCGYLPLMAYVVDALGLYSASGMTALIVTRCLAGTFFPLTTEPLVRNLGYGWGFTVLASISIALAPIPILLFRYGAKWRQGSVYTRGE